MTAKFEVTCDGCGAIIERDKNWKLFSSTSLIRRYPFCKDFCGFRCIILWCEKQ